MPNNYVAKLAHQADQPKVKKTSWGFWHFPARSHYVTKQTVVINGRKRIKKRRHETDIGEPILLLESRKQTTFKPIIDLDALFELARQTSADKFEQQAVLNGNKLMVTMIKEPVGFFVFKESK